MRLKKIKIVAYEPAFGIIGDPAKRDPHTRQSADHSMVFIVSRMLQKAIALRRALDQDVNEAWKALMLMPIDYGKAALSDPVTRKLMSLIEFAHGGKEYDDNYPEGIPSSVVITDSNNNEHDSKFVMFPGGHALNKTCDLEQILKHKFLLLGSLAVEDVQSLLDSVSNLSKKTKCELQTIYDVPGLKLADKKPITEQDY